jgi:MazG family protein
MENPGSFQRLVAIMDRLRGEDGCPWDREQSYESLRGYLLEECYEVAEAIDEDSRDGLCEELGDLLFQIVFLARLAKEERAFTVEDVVAGIAEKMVRRHPHIFGDGTADTALEVLRNWEEIKREEKREAGGEEADRSVLDGIPGALPALLRAQRLGAKAARVGFDWDEESEILDKVREEIDELRDAFEKRDRDAIREEIGDEIDPEGALQRSNTKFQERFRWIERELKRRGRAIEETDLDELERLWGAAKREHRPAAD